MLAYGLSAGGFSGALLLNEIRCGSRGCSFAYDIKPDGLPDDLRRILLVSNGTDILDVFTIGFISSNNFILLFIFI